MGFTISPKELKARLDKGDKLVLLDVREQWEFDLAKISDAIKQHLDAYEAGGHRGNTFTFTEKKYAIDPKELSVVAFVQDDIVLAGLIGRSIPPAADGQPYEREATT